MPDEIQAAGGEGLLREYGSLVNPTMILSAIVDEICNRVNDPFNDNYATRAESLFLLSLYDNIADERFTPFDYNGLVGKHPVYTGASDTRVIDLLGDDNELETNSYIIKINTIVSTEISENNTATRKFVPISIEEANRIATDPDLEPIFGEVYWYMIGQNLYFHPSPSENMKNLRFVIEYIHSGEMYSENQDMCTLFSIPYLSSCMDIATGKLLQEINLS